MVCSQLAHLTLTIVLKITPAWTKRRKDAERKNSKSPFKYKRHLNFTVFFTN